MIDNRPHLRISVEDKTTSSLLNTEILIGVGVGENGVVVFDPRDGGNFDTLKVTIEYWTHDGTNWKQETVLETD